MIAQQLLRLIQQLSFVYGAGTLVTPPQLLQDLLPCRLTHCFIHSRHGNSHFWHNVSFPLSLTPLPGNKTFGAIRMFFWHCTRSCAAIKCGYNAVNTDDYDATSSSRLLFHG